MARIYLDERDQEQSSSPSTGGRVYLDERDAPAVEQPAQSGFSLKSAFSNFISKVQGVGKSLAESTGINATIQDLNQETLDIYKQSELTSQLRTVSILQEKASKAKDEDTRNRFLEMARKASEQANTIASEVGGELKNKTDKQLRGQALQTGIDVGTALPLGIAAKGAQTAVEVAPKTLPAIFKAIAKSTGKGAAEAGAIGAPYGVAQSFAEGEEDPKEVIKNAIETAKNFAIFGGATNAVVGTLTAALAKFKKSPKVELKEESSPKKEEIVNQEPKTTAEKRKVSMADVSTNRDTIVPLKQPEIDVERPAVQDIKAPATQEPKSLTKEEFVTRVQARQAEAGTPKLEVPSQKKTPATKVEKEPKEPLVKKEDVPRETQVKVKNADERGTPRSENGKSLGDPVEGAVYYHGTVKENKASLLKSGFNPKLNKKGFAEQPEAFYIGDYKEASMYGDDMVGVRVKNGVKVKTLQMSSKEWAETVGKSKSKEETASALRELRKRGYDAINAGDEIEILNPKKFEVIEAKKEKSLYEQVTGKKPPEKKDTPSLKIPSQTKEEPTPSSKPKLEIPSQKKVEVKAPAPEKKASIPVKVDAKPIEGTEKTKTRGLSRGVEQKAVEKKLTEGFGSLPEYKGVSMKDQAEKAYKIVDENPEYAKQIAMGTARPPEGVLPESVFIAVENEAIANGDAALLQALATQSTRVGEATTMGQRIRVLAERNPDSPVANIKDVASSREKLFEEQTGKKVKDEKKAVKSEVKEKMKKEVPTKEDWGKFLDDIQC